MNHFSRLMACGGAVLALAACEPESRAPAGGYGYFDPPPAAPYVQPPEAISTLPGGTAQPAPQSQFTPNGGTPTTPDADPNAALARDVRGALGATSPGIGTADTASGVATTPLSTDTGIDPNDDSINLNLSSQEQQKREREAAARQREAAQNQLVVIEPTPVPQQNINANVVAFARETTHPVGTKRYNRPAFRDRLQSGAVCRRFDNMDEAQRQFLANGGPTTDRYNLDPDGDGFACKFDPEKYRKLNF